MSEYSHDSDSSSCCSHVYNPHTATGVKGSDVYTSAGVGDARVALSTQLVRGAPSESIRVATKAILSSGSDEVLRDAVVMAFQARDVRGGKGERQLFYDMLQAVHEVKPSLATALLPLVPEYGSWGDMFTIAEGVEGLRPAVLKEAKAQLEADEAKILTDSKASLSLLAKWAPREGKAGSALAREFAKLLRSSSAANAKGAKHSGVMASYRKRLAALNRHLKTVETYECAGRWDEIEPARVPARAREIKKAAYLNEAVKKQRGLEPSLRAPADEKRMACRSNFQSFFAAAAEGKVKISGADTLYPHELVKKATLSLRAGALSDDEANSMDAVWAQMVEKAQAGANGSGGGLGSSLFMCDFSGSMESSPTGDTPYWVSAAMGLLGSSVAAPPFKNRFLTFDFKPQWYVLPEEAEANTLSAKLRHIAQTTRLGQGTSTDFQAAGEEILKQLKAARAPPGASPKNLIVVTDMGFDQACSSSDSSYYTGATYRHNVKTAKTQTHAQMLREAFRRASEDVHGDPEAWPAPRIIIWNVAATYSSNHQAKAHEEGVLTLSGWSPSLFKVLCEEGPRAVTSYEVLRLQLDAPRYDAVRERVDAWLAGGWREVI
jgi:hypothetical protein